MVAYQTIYVENTGDLTIIRPDKIKITCDGRKLYFELERRFGIQGATAMRLDNQENVKKLYKIALEMEQYIKYEEVTN